MTKTSKKQKAEHAQGETGVKNDALSACKYPDFAARRKKIFGGRVLTVVDDVVKDRGRF
jgi:hypothetical protein